MAFKVVLVRHGKAKNKKLGETDFERELTRKGREALAETYETTFAPIAHDEQLELWVSPAVRAQQTAAEVVACIDAELEDMRTLDCLYEQDAEAFITELAIRQAEGDATVVAVGHIPFMEDVAYLLGGVDLSFAPGAAAAFELREDLGELGSAFGAPAKLLWFVQGPEVD